MISIALFIILLILWLSKSAIQKSWMFQCTYALALVQALIFFFITYLSLSAFIFDFITGIFFSSVNFKLFLRFDYRFRFCGFQKYQRFDCWNIFQFCEFQTSQDLISGMYFSSLNFRHFQGFDYWKLYQFQTFQRFHYWSGIYFSSVNFRDVRNLITWVFSRLWIPDILQSYHHSCHIFIVI